MAIHVMTDHATIRISGHRPSTPAFLIGLRGFVQKLIASWAWYDGYRQSVRELNDLTDRELDDIGVARCDVPLIAKASADAAAANIQR